MANPTLISLSADSWQIVAAGVKTGVVYPKNREKAPLWFTYRNAGDPPPSGFDGTEKPLTSDYALISNDIPIDVYFMRQNSDGEVTVYL